MLEKVKKIHDKHNTSINVNVWGILTLVYDAEESAIAYITATDNLNTEELKYALTLKDNYAPSLDQFRRNKAAKE